MPVRSPRPFVVAAIVAVVLLVTWVVIGYSTAARNAHEVVVGQELWREVGAPGADAVVVAPVGFGLADTAGGSKQLGWIFEIAGGPTTARTIRLVVSHAYLGGFNWRSVSRVE